MVSAWLELELRFDLIVNKLSIMLWQCLDVMVGTDALLYSKITPLLYYAPDNWNEYYYQPFSTNNAVTSPSSSS